MGDDTEDLGRFRLTRDHHPDGTVFYDVYGYKFLLHNDTKVVTKLSDEPDATILHNLRSVSGSPLTDALLRRAVVMSGNGVFRRLSYRKDPRELCDAEYQGELMYNMESDADMHYLMFNRVDISPLESESISGNLTIRGSFKRIAIIDSNIIDAKITIISDRNPEIFIIGSNMSESSLRIVDGNGNEYVSDKIRVSNAMPPPDELNQLIDYIRSDEDDILDEDDDSPSDNSIFGIGTAACLAMVGMMAAAKSMKSKRVVVEECKYERKR